MESTVKSQMETYSSTVAKKCSSAFTPQQLQAAVCKVEDKKERRQNVVIYGLEEEQSEQLQLKVETILADLLGRNLSSTTALGLGGTEQMQPDR